jgi:nucleoredoxin
MIRLLAAILLATALAAADAPGFAQAIDRLGAQLAKPDGSAVASAGLAGKPYLVLYFSAHWCPPCRAFTPKLVEFYKQKGGGTAFEIVFVSADRSAEDQAKYIKDAGMPWPAVPFARAQTVAQQYGIGGIPNLIILTPDGSVVAQSEDRGNYIAPDEILAGFLKTLQAPAKP